MRAVLLLVLILSACAGDDSADASRDASPEPDTGADVAIDVPTDAADATADAPDSDVDAADAMDVADTGVTDTMVDAPDALIDADFDTADSGGAETRYVMTSTRVTDEHRFVPGAMFGGWGPHLGHLMRVDDVLYWVDDVCDQDVAGDCDVLRNRRVGVFRRRGESFERIATVPLPSQIQQNTGAFADGEVIRIYGVNVSANRVEECTVNVRTLAQACAPIPITTGPNANYIGAARAPSGARLAWWTNVVDGGGGSFSYVVDYEGGWNGPRRGPIGGFNDCAYAHAVFPPGTGFHFFCQVVSGRAPDWTFATLLGDADLSTSSPATWTSALAPVAGDAVTSTNDFFVDASEGLHLLARTSGGAAAYFYRAAGGASFGAARHVFPSTFRARFLPTRDALGVLTGPSTGGVELRVATADGPLPLDELPVFRFPLPATGRVNGIYPVAPVYQTDPLVHLEAVVVGQENENVVTHLLFEQE